MGAIKKLTLTINSIGRVLTEFVYPPFCVLCENRLEPSNKIVCEKCWDSLPKVFPACIDANSFRKSLSKEPYFKNSVARWQYTDSAQQIIHLFKYSGYRHLSQRLGDNLGLAAIESEEFKTADVIVPVPLHRIRKREREFNQSQLLAERVSEIIGLPMETRILRRIRYTKPQARLGAHERRHNVRGAFAVGETHHLQGFTVIVIDDVITTGSTINECAKVVKEAGASEVLALTCFRA